MKTNNYKQALEYLESFIGKIYYKIDPQFLRHHDPLERMRIFLSLLGDPQEKFKSILVGGTSGKGSTAYLISHILKTAGYKVGLTISPHLQKVNERLQINGEQISDEKFTDIVSSMIQTIELMRKMPVGAPSYFEILIAMAFKYFVDRKVDIAVAEVGMGGEFDATNTLYPLVAVLTNVGLDHTDILGKTIEKIARTKAGIIKLHGVLSKVIPPASAPSTGSVRAVGSPSSFATPLVVISGVKKSSVIKIIEDRCEKVGAKLFRLGKDFDESIIENYKLSLLGDYQKENASLAVEAVLQLKKFGFSHFAEASRDKKVLEKDIRKALSTAFFPGRFEVIKCHPELVSGSPARRQVSLRKNEMLKPVQHDKKATIVLDGAHNPVKMKEFLKSLKKLFPKKKKIFIIGFKFDKDIKKMLREIVKVADEIIVTEFSAKTDVSLHASADAESIKYEVLSIKKDVKVAVEKDSQKALEKALVMSNLAMKQFNNRAIIVVTGSLYLVGEIRSYLFSSDKKFIRK